MTARGFAIVCGAALALGGCGRQPAPGKSAPPPPAASAPDRKAPAPHFAVKPVAQKEGNATWYDVPAGSLPERRAWAEEMTAASDTIPLGRYVRVTTLGNGKSVIVRITDTGIHKRGTLIDVCKEAAAELGMVGKGEARVRVEELALDNAAVDRPADPRDGAAARKAPVPAASADTEKKAAEAKAAP